MDAFFASVEERYTPRFKGLPLVVGSEPHEGKGRGVVSTANYKAREYGIHSAMPISHAWKLSQQAKNQGKPEAIFLPVDFELYEKSSRNIYKIIKRHSNLAEPASIDEFYFDLTFAKNFKKAEQICKKIKKDIKQEEKITCSIGLGPNKLIAKIAAGINKPNGFFAVKQKEAEKFLELMNIREIPGIGPKTEMLLNQLDIKTVKDLKKLSKEYLKSILHKWGEDLYFKIRAIDNSPVVEDREVKSIGEQGTFSYDTLDALFVCQKLEKMCQRVFERFLKSGFKAFKTIAITVRFSDFQTKTTARTPKQIFGKNDLAKFKLEALKLLLPYLDKRKNPKLKKLRLVGIRVENFCNIMYFE